jgi:hypothetical protein
LDLTEFYLALNELATDERRFGPTHMDPALFSHATTDASPAQSLDFRMASNSHVLGELPSPPAGLFNPFMSLRDMAPYPSSSHGFHSDLALHPTAGTMGSSYAGVIPRDTGQYFGHGISNMSLADNAFTSTAAAPPFNLDAHMPNVFDPANFPAPTPTSDSFGGMSMNAMSTGGTPSSNALHFSDSFSAISPFDLPVFPAMFSSSASAGCTQQGSRPGLVDSLAEHAIGAQPESVTGLAIRPPSYGAASNDSVQNHSDLLANVSSPLVSYVPLTGVVVWE